MTSDSLLFTRKSCIFAETFQFTIHLKKYAMEFIATISKSKVKEKPLTETVPKKEVHTKDKDILKTAQEWEIDPDELEIIMDISKKINHNIAKHWDEQLDKL